MAVGLRWSDLELCDLLGTGRSGRVYRARLRRPAYGLESGHFVAVKQYAAWVLDEAGFIERLFREVSVGRCVRHPNVLRIYGALLTDDGQPALVMDLSDGPTLEQVLRHGRAAQEPLDFDMGIRTALEIASGLEAIHSCGMLHRDLKPANILMANHGAVIADFGVVKNAAMPEQTTTGTFLGTIRYAAPEYLFGSPFTEKCDIYSFGCVAYEIFTNSETHGDRQHWADLVMRVRYESPEISVEMLNAMVARFGLLRTEFLKLVIENTVCRSSHLRLPLACVIKAVSKRAWKRTVRRSLNRLRSGPFHHGDAFDTAANAAAELRLMLSELEMTQLCALLYQQHWGDSVAGSVNSFIRKLRRLGVLTYRRDRDRLHPDEKPYYYYFEVPGSIREAFVLGLLEHK